MAPWQIKRTCIQTSKTCKDDRSKRQKMIYHMLEGNLAGKFNVGNTGTSYRRVHFVELVEASEQDPLFWKLTAPPNGNSAQMLPTLQLARETCLPVHGPRDSSRRNVSPRGLLSMVVACQTAEAMSHRMAEIDESIQRGD